MMGWVLGCSAEDARCTTPPTSARAARTETRDRRSARGQQWRGAEHAGILGRGTMQRLCAPCGQNAVAPGPLVHWRLFLAFRHRRDERACARGGRGQGTEALTGRGGVGRGGAGFWGRICSRVGTVSALDRTVHVGTACMRGRLRVWHTPLQGQASTWMYTSLRSACTH